MVDADVVCCSNSFFKLPVGTFPWSPSRRRAPADKPESAKV